MVSQLHTFEMNPQAPSEPVADETTIRSDIESLLTRLVQQRETPVERPVPRLVYSNTDSLTEDSAAQRAGVAPARVAASASGLGVGVQETANSDVLLPKSLKAGLAKVSSGLTNIVTGQEATSPSQVVADWSDFVSEAKAHGSMIDVNALVQQVLREAYKQNTDDLQFYAEKVKYFNEVKKQVRNELKRARNRLAQVAKKDSKDSIAPFQKKRPLVEFTGGKNVKWVNDGKAKTKGQLEAYVSNMEDTMSSVGDDAQLANVDLQNTLQRQQQTLQTLSNISKMLHDTAMATIRKIGA